MNPSGFYVDPALQRKKDGSEKEADEIHGHKKRSTAVLQPLLTLNLIL